jgi:hypothetical protein
MYSLAEGASVGSPNFHAANVTLKGFCHKKGLLMGKTFWFNKQAQNCNILTRHNWLHARLIQ